MPKNWNSTEYADHLNGIRHRLEEHRDLVLGNVIRIGEVPSHPPPDFSEGDMGDLNFPNPRARCFAERLTEIGVDECSADDAGNPIGVLKGRQPSLPPIFVSSEIDSKYQPPWDYHYSLDGESITGSGLMDNAIGAASLLNFADFAKREGIRFESDVYLIGFTNTMEPGKYYESIDRFLDNFRSKIRAAVIIKGGELGRLNYFCRAMIRAEALCERSTRSEQCNMVEIAHDIIDRLLALRMPRKPKTDMTIGRVESGRKHGEPAAEALIGFELRSESNDILEEIFGMIGNITSSVEHERAVRIALRILSRRGSSGIPFEHGLTQAAIKVMEALGLTPDISASVSELYSFQKRGIASVTIGMTEGFDYHTEDTKALILPLFTGLAQMFGIVEAIDQGACDD